MNATSRDRRIDWRCGLRRAVGEPHRRGGSHDRHHKHSAQENGWTKADQ